LITYLIYTYSVYNLEKLVYLNIAMATIIANRIDYTVDVIVRMNLSILTLKIFSEKCNMWYWTILSYSMYQHFWIH